MREGRKQKRTRFTIGLAAAGLLALTVAPSASATPKDTRAGNGAVSFGFIREDTTSIEYTDTIIPPGRVPIVGDFLGTNDGVGHLDDILWYTPGTGGDALWRTKGDRSWASSPISISGIYTPIVGSFGCDYFEDIFWYAPGAGQDVLWDFNEDGSITKTNYNVSGTYTPVPGDFTEDGCEDLIWYAPGTAGDAWWDFNQGGGKTDKPIDIKGTFKPVTGSFAGFGSPSFDYVDDIIWYAPGTGADSLWNFKGAAGTITKTPLTINGTFTPIPGDFTHDGYNDVIWYAPGSGQDYLWDFDNAAGSKTSSPLTINGSYTPVTGEIFEQGAHQTDILWFGSSGKPDALWDFDFGPGFTSRPVSLFGNQTPLLAYLERTHGGGLDIIDRTL